MDIAGKKVLVTGAAGGIGRAICQHFSQLGAELIISGRRQAALSELADSLGNNVSLLVADLSTDEGIAQVLAQAQEVDIFICNAGQPGTDEITNYSPEQIDEHLAVNLRAPILLSRGLIPAMKARGAGHIVFISSIAGKVPSPLSSLYSAGKYGLRGYADCLRMDLKESGVGVSGVYPGIIRDAGMYANSGAAIPTGAPSNTTEDVAKAVAKAVSRNLASVNVTGLAVRTGVHLAHFSPGLNFLLQKLAGAKSAAQAFSDGHKPQ